MPAHVIQFEQLLTRQEAARELRLQAQTLAVWACTDRYNLPYVKIGRRVMYRRSDLEAFINANLISQEAA